MVWGGLSWCADPSARDEIKELIEKVVSGKRIYTSV
jgi:hypothetical protein